MLPANHSYNYFLNYIFLDRLPPSRQQEAVIDPFFAPQDNDCLSSRAAAHLNLRLL